MRCCARMLWAALMLLGGLAAPYAQTPSFATLATISSSLGVNADRLCVGEASRQDIGCPSYAPSLSSGGLLTATTLAAGGFTVTGATSLNSVSVTALQLGSGGSCSTGTAGNVRYSSSGGTVELCIGTGWVPLVSGTLPCTGDFSTWTARESNRGWWSITSSADGTKLAAVVDGGQIYTSSDSGVTWTARESSRNWRSITSSADGTKLAAIVYGGQIYTSTDSGVTWTARESNRNWQSITSSADGAKLAATVWGGQIYTSTGCASGGTGGGGGTTAPGGSNGQVQFNNSGAFGGDSGLTYSGGLLTASTMAAGGFTVTGATNLMGGASLGDALNGTSANFTSQVVSHAYNAGSNTSFDWNNGNVQYTNTSCGAFSFSNMLDGGSYNLVVTGASSGSCTFSHTGLTFLYPTGYGVTTASTHTVFAFLRAGANVYVTAVRGLQ